MISRQPVVGERLDPALQSRVTALAAEIAALPWEAREHLTIFFEPHRLRQCRLRDRDLCYRMAAEARNGDASKRAAEIHRELSLYRSGVWRFEKDLPAPPDPQRSLYWRILKIDNGEILSVSRLRRLLANVAKKTADLGHGRGVPQRGIDSDGSDGSSSKTETRDDEDVGGISRAS